ncbi:MAG: hypothetical protein ACKOJF_03160, partial [Planctomycetaceae bacterium]
MPLPMKTLREVSAELGIPEAEIRTMLQLQKVRGVMRRGQLMFAPDEIARIKRQRKTLPESAREAPPAPIAPKPSIPPKAPPPPT